MAVALPTELSRPSPDLSTKTTLIYGIPKIGKSTVASRFPDALFLECEPGLNELEVYKIPTYSWEDVLAACSLVAAGEHQFKTIVIDTVDNAFRMCSDYVCAKHGVEYEGDLGHGKGWAFVKNEWHRVLTRLASLPYGLILISHAIDKRIETRTGEYTRTQPSLPDRARGVVLGLVDMILFCDSVARKAEDGSVVVDRVIRTKPHPTYEAGDRTGRLPETLPLDFDAFARCFPSGDVTTSNTKESQMNDAVQTFEPPVPTAIAAPGESTFSGAGMPVDLAAFDDDFAQAEAVDFEEVPDGKYQVRIHTVRVGESQKGDPMLKWDLFVLSGSYGGRHLFKNSVITSSSLPFVKGDLETLGLKLERFSDLPSRLGTLLDLTLEVTKRTKGEYTNVYFNRLMEIPAGDAPFDPSKEPVPF